MRQTIEIRGARTHNLQNVTVDIPRDKMVVITGLSGSGKSSLAFDTLYAEGQRRYVESLSAYARQFLSMMEKPDVDAIEGLSPAISIDQKAASHNPRSTVGTITEIHDYLRLLYARIGKPQCPEHGVTLEAQTISQMVDQVMAYPEGTKLMLMAPVVRQRKGSYVQLFQKYRSQGFIRARVDGEVIELDNIPDLEHHKKHDIDIVIDRFKVREGLEQRLAESFETATRIAEGLACIVSFSDQQQIEEQLFSANFACPACGFSVGELEPKLFSFNNPAGACPGCDGLGARQVFDPDKIVQDPELSLQDGAIRGWDRKHGYYFSILRALAQHYDFDIRQPFKNLRQSIKHMLFYGSDEPVELPQMMPGGTIKHRNKHFPGIIRHMERRYQDTESSSVREDLSRFITSVICDDCQGGRLNATARHVFVGEKNLAQLSGMAIDKALTFLNSLTFSGKRAQIADKILREVTSRLQFLVNVGLDYLSLARNAESLSGGEAQRIRLASQMGSGLVGVMYILDEPTIGLHQRDNDRLLATLKQLRDLGNTVIVVEHDEDTIRSADHVVDMGPGAGIHGGHLVAHGTPQQIQDTQQSLTGQYLRGDREISIPHKRPEPAEHKWLTIHGASCNNLQHVRAQFPLGLFIGVTGVSGSGKSSLVNDTLAPAVTEKLQKVSAVKPGSYQQIDGLEWLDKVVAIDQSPIGRTPRSNPATYTGLFTPIRELFAGTQEARSRGYKPGRFSFNVQGGRCEACQGEGVIKVEMHFLADIHVVCEICQGKRYNRETLEVKYKGKSIHDVLAMTVEEARDFFDSVPLVARKLQTLMDVGLSYVHLGQSAPTLSGGEAQRVKLARELSRRDTGRTLYILDEPTTGLHFHDVKQLLHVLHQLRERGNTVVVIEHNLDVIKTADWLIDLGPEGGDNGGYIVASGTPETVADNERSYTGHYLKPVLQVK